MSRRDESDNKVEPRRAEMLMRRAIALTEGTRPHPNPRVGAIVLSPDGVVLAEFAHGGPGTPHAEAAAIESAGPNATGATVVVSLEPCVHHGRTPPCTDALIDAGVARVIVGALDPDEKVAGAGVRRLAQAGIDVVSEVAAGAVEASDPGYFHHRRTGRPRVTLKTAATLDGQVAATDTTSQWITSEAARRDAHRLRAEADAIMIGAGTLRADDPRLSVRLEGYAGRQPRPIIVAGQLPLPVGAAVYKRDPLIYRHRIVGDEPSTAEIVDLPGSGGVDLEGAMKDLGSRGVVDLLVEGGPTLATALAEAELIDRLILYFGAKLAGGVGRAMLTGSFTTLADARPLHIEEVTRLGPDIKVVAAPAGQDM